MRAEVIIACRGELAANLHRTVKNLLDTIGDDDGINVVMDGMQSVPYKLGKRVSAFRPWQEARGPGQARHWAITRSEAKYLVLIDGHMTFPPGWLDEVCTHLAKSHCGRDITCCHMRSLKKDWSEFEGQTDYAGAYLALKSFEDGNQYWALSAKWNREVPGKRGGKLTADYADPTSPKWLRRTGGRGCGVVPAVMGACYGMRRSWYKKIGEPLGILEAWGGDEELLSLCSWLCGGRVYLLPVMVGHVYAAPCQRVKSDVRRERADVWANRYAILEALPIPKAEKNELTLWLDKTPVRQEVVQERLAARAKRIDVLQKYLKKNTKHNWQWLRAREIVRPVTSDQSSVISAEKNGRKIPAAPRRDGTPQVIIRKSTICEMCDAVNSFVQISGVRQHPAYGKAYARCKRCGHKAHIKVME